MLYGKMTFLLTSEISFLHSVQIMARRLVLLITLVRVPEDSGNSQISSSGNTVYVVWQEGISGNTDIFYTTNNEDFGLFGSALNLSNNAGNSVNPQISSSP